MELKIANHQDQLEIFEYYQRKSLEELQRIKPRWAHGKYANKILDCAQSPLNNRYIIFNVQVKELIDKSTFNEVDLTKLFTGDIVNDTRIAKILARWDNHLFVDPPTIFLGTQCKDKLQFSDGRHRAKLTYLLGIKTIPIAVDRSDIDTVSQMLSLSELK